MLPKMLLKGNDGKGNDGKEDAGTADARRELEKLIEAEEKRQGGGK